MERLTERSENGRAVYRHPTPESKGWKSNRAAVLERCCKYEDTGLAPEEIMNGRMLTGWIPVEECTPKESGRYVVTAAYADPAWPIYMCDTADWDEGLGWDTDVVAWLPGKLPEPYVKQNEDLGK